jgi:hypothetical protein
MVENVSLGSLTPKQKKKFEKKSFLEWKSMMKCTIGFFETPCTPKAASQSS